MKSTLIKPVITEKTLTLAGRGWFTFMVKLTAVKGDIAHTVSTFYKVKVIEVRTMTMPGKMRRVGKGMKPRQQPHWKKAMVHLAKGQKIDVFEVTGAPTEEKSVKGSK